MEFHRVLSQVGTIGGVTQLSATTLDGCFAGECDGRGEYRRTGQIQSGLIEIVLVAHVEVTLQSVMGFMETASNCWNDHIGNGRDREGQMMEWDICVLILISF